MTDPATGDSSWMDGHDEPDPISTIEAYEIDEGVVLYDAENPLAWLQSTGFVSLEDVL